jgi:spermidine/putrescine transport system ATP-binding protein
MEYKTPMSTTHDSISPDIQFDQVTKRYADVVAVDNVSLSIERGEFFSFLGPSGCGKTTSLRLIAGFDQPTKGDVHIGGVSVIGVPPHKRPVNMVFQHYALFPHMTIADNIGYGLRQRIPKPAKSEIYRQVDEILEMVQMSGYGNRRIWELSGGQQQRVALARALINRPTVLLLDEPLAALDRKLRREMQIELQTLQRDVGITFILVTHDQEEALSMSDRICIMRNGHVVQSGGPRELYDQPTNLYVADFVGKSNFIAGSVTNANGQSVTIRSENGQAFAGCPSASAAGLSVGASASIAIRPELIVMRTHNTSASDMETDVALNGRIKNRIFLGEHTEYLVDSDGLGDVLVLSPKHIESARGGFNPGDAIAIGWKNDTALALEDS